MLLPVLVLKQNALVAVGVKGITLRVLGAECLARVVAGRFCGREGVEGAIGVAAGTLRLDPRASGSGSGNGTGRRRRRSRDGRRRTRRRTRRGSQCGSRCGSQCSSRYWRGGIPNIARLCAIVGVALVLEQHALVAVGIE